MSPLDFSCSRLQAFLEEAARLQDSDFPYPHSREALEEIERQFQQSLERLREFTPESNAEVVRQQCAISLRGLAICVPLLGFVLRSTNARNAFEIYGPLLRLCRSVLEPHTTKSRCLTRLLLSSEWAYSPFVYREFTELPNFVLIGLPAQESDNPLLVPLAGHELGHSYWAKYSHSQTLQSIGVDAILTIIRGRWQEYLKVFPGPPVGQEELKTNMFALQSWSPAVPLLMSQAEESFCDYIGLRIFGSSYLNAFAYITSPRIAGPRAAYYPGLQTRAANLLKAAIAYGIVPRSDFTALFEDNELPKLSESQTFLLTVADEALEHLTSTLISIADEAVIEAGIACSTREEVQRIRKRFEYAVPAENARCLADILNASWDAFEDQSLWNNIPHMSAIKSRALKELTLKSIEIFEIEQIMSEQPENL
jgi:hypothetical protein